MLIDDKMDRARRILGSVKALVARDYGAKARKYPVDEIQTTSAPGGWSATITRRASSEDAALGDLPRDRWDFLHLHVDDALVLALKFHDTKAELIKFHPGPWERWFGTFDLSDRVRFPA